MLRFFIMAEPKLRRAAKVVVGDLIDVVVEPTTDAAVLEKAREQAKLTTVEDEVLVRRALARDFIKEGWEADQARPAPRSRLATPSTPQVLGSGAGGQHVYAILRATDNPLALFS